MDDPPEPLAFTSDVQATDHNLYVVDGFVFQANYRAGLRVLDMRGVARGSIREVGHYDIYPPGDGTAFSGAWTAYPFHGSDLVTMSGIEQGLFVLQFTGRPEPPRHVPL